MIIVPMRLAFTALLCLFAALLLWQTLALGRVARLAPLWVIVPTFGLLLLQLVLDLFPQLARRLPRGWTFGPAEAGTPELAPETLGSAMAGISDRRGGREAETLAWLAGLAVIVQVVGVILAVPLFLFAYLVSRSGEPWWRAAAFAIAAFVLLRLGLPSGLGIEFAPAWSALAWF
jgi:hypothetical protein